MKPSWRQPWNNGQKGLIFRISKKDTTLYSAAQFVIGIWEYHVNRSGRRTDPGCQRIHAHLDEKKLAEPKTKQLRVVPVAKSVSAEMAIMPFEAAEAIINNNPRSWCRPASAAKSRR
jgi:electron transport complex protein RnfB